MTQTPKSVLFLTTSGVYDNRLLHVIDNTILYVQRGADCVIFYTTNNHLNSEANQFCSHGLTSMTPVMSLLLRVRLSPPSHAEGPTMHPPGGKVLPAAGVGAVDGRRLALPLQPLHASPAGRLPPAVRRLRMRG